MFESPIYDQLISEREPTPIYDQALREFTEKKRKEYAIRNITFVTNLLGDSIQNAATSLRLFRPDLLSASNLNTIFEDHHTTPAYASVKKEKLMNEMQKKVQEFHEAFGHGVNEAPRLISVQEINLRKELMIEELVGAGELVDSMQKQDLVGVADGLADVLYVVLGTAVAYGIDIEPIFNEVHASNMSKLGGDGKPILSRGMNLDGAVAGKVLEGPNFFEPKIGLELNKQTTYGHEDPTVYKASDIPITLGIGGPKIGQGKIVMDHNGNVEMNGVMDDVSILPVIDHLGFSVSGLSIGDDEPPAELHGVYSEVPLTRAKKVYPEYTEELFHQDVGEGFPMPLLKTEIKSMDSLLLHGVHVNEKTTEKYKFPLPGESLEDEEQSAPRHRSNFVEPEVDNDLSVSFSDQHVADPYPGDEQTDDFVPPYDR